VILSRHDSFAVTVQNFDELACDTPIAPLTTICAATAKQYTTHGPDSTQPLRAMIDVHDHAA
jgi:hypothetical protein